MVLYYALLLMELIFNAFGLTWISVVSGLVLSSVLLRLFAANLVGSAHGVFNQAGSVRQPERRTFAHEPVVSRLALPSGHNGKLRKG